MTHSARLILNKGVRHRILDGHPWVFASEVDRTEGKPEDGGTVEICSPKGGSLGSALYNSRSQIVARRYDLGLRALDGALIGPRLDEALAWRDQRGKWGAGMARRLVWSESDQLPGLIVDRYDDVLVLQTLTLAMARREEMIVELLLKKTGCRTVLARNDAPVRQLEGLPLERKVLHGDYKAPTRVRIAGIDYDLDLWSGQKTGFYLDQAENYAAVAACSTGRRVLDCFTNQGAFALSAAKAGAASCRGIDQSAEALRLAETTSKAAGLAVDWVQGNVFDLLREYEQRHATFDLVVLDPPSFTKSKGNKNSALRGYHELHLRALRLLTRGGILATFSCSHHVTAEDWSGLLQRAASETGSTLRLRERLGQSSDHPVLVNVPETEYLRGYVLEKVNAEMNSRTLLLALAVSLLLPSLRAQQPPSQLPPPLPPVARKPAPLPPVRKIKGVDADNRSVWINRPGMVTLLLGTGEDSQNQARQAGKTVYPFRGRPDFQLVVVVDLRDSLAGWVSTLALEQMRANLDKEAVELKPYYLKNGNRSDPRKTSYVIADFKGTICPQLGWPEGSDKLRGILYGADGRELKRWDTITDMQKLYADVHAALQDLVDVNQAKATAAAKAQEGRVFRPPTPPLPLPAPPPAPAAK